MQGDPVQIARGRGRKKNSPGSAGPWSRGQGSDRKPRCHLPMGMTLRFPASWWPWLGPITFIILLRMPGSTRSVGPDSPGYRDSLVETDV